MQVLYTHYLIVLTIIMKYNPNESRERRIMTISYIVIIAFLFYGLFSLTDILDEYREIELSYENQYTNYLIISADTGTLLQSLHLKYLALEYYQTVIDLSDDQTIKDKYEQMRWDVAQEINELSDNFVEQMNELNDSHNQLNAAMDILEQNNESFDDLKSVTIVYQIIIPIYTFIMGLYYTKEEEIKSMAILGSSIIIVLALIINVWILMIINGMSL